MSERSEMTVLAPDPARPIGLMLSGGGARGAFQVGVWKVLSEHPRGLRGAPCVISGTSAGALNGALIAAGLSAEAMLEFWLDLAHDPPVVANERFFTSLRRTIRDLVLREPVRRFARRRREARIIKRLLAKHTWYRGAGTAAMALEYMLTARYDNISRLLRGIDTPYLFDAQGLRERLHRALGTTELRETHVKLAINTVDAASGQVVRLVNHKPNAMARSARFYHYTPAITLDMIVASAAIPLLFNAVRVDGMDLWDGGLLVNSPLAPAVALGAQRIIPVLVTVRAGAGAAPRLETFGHALERVIDTFLENAYSVDRKLLLERNVLASRLPENGMQEVGLFRPIRPETSRLFDAGSYLYFERDKLVAMYEAGQRAARAWFARGPEADDRHLAL